MLRGERFASRRKEQWLAVLRLVAVKNKFQIVIPQHIREQVHVEIGDFLEASVEGGKITFTPKSLIDRHLAEALRI